MPLNDEISKKVRRLILIGEAAGRMNETWKDLTETVIMKTLESAVQEAYRSALPEETIILSPASSSFDMFDSFEERGNRESGCC